MDTRWLQDFLTLAEVGNFTRAAELRHTSQAAFSRRIQNLENWVGARLIDRGRYPVYLTPAGENLQKVAADILSQLQEIKAGTAESPALRTVRIALPYTLAVSRLPAWWKAWSRGQNLTCHTRVGSVLETTASFTAGAADILIGYYQPTQSMPLETSAYEKAVLLSETLRPYVAQKLLDAKSFDFPGTPERPVPFLNYSKDVYFHRLVNHVIEHAGEPFHGMLHVESEMSEVLNHCVLEGLGVGWLSDSSLIHPPSAGLVNLDQTGAWSVDVDVVAFVARDKMPRHIKKVWQRILDWS